MNAQTNKWIGRVRNSPIVCQCLIACSQTPFLRSLLMPSWHELVKQELVKSTSLLDDKDTWHDTTDLYGVTGESETRGDSRSH